MKIKLNYDNTIKLLICVEKITIITAIIIVLKFLF